MSKRKKFIIGMIIAVFLFVGGSALHQLVSSLRYINNLVISTPDLSRVQDGVFNGTFETPILSANVDVLMENHRITEIRINDHNYGRGGGAEIITDDVIAQQSLEVDTISGATSSSLVILRAIQDALESGIN